ncbi:ABC transporter permease [Acetobacter sacchari]|uniref:ABC transporter permease n=1 Tax=Acetobacter sacchari TaxID=2661687 RepID=A0ABS3M0E3_9PROT|nr:ABC transporter permease [Acetobacter sacchari]MBO1361609.1 ABC transporter permease [Acetobacter sacchari]
MKALIKIVSNRSVHQPSIRSLFKIQGRVIGALMLRELHTRFGRENLGYLWIIGEPILFCLGVTIAWTAMRAPHEHGLPMTAIVLTGYVPLTMWRHSLVSAVRAFEANGSLLFHRQVTPLDIITARVALEVMGTLMAGLIVAVGAVLIGYMKPPENYGLLYLGLGFHILFCFATALLVAALSERSEIIEKTVSIFSYLALPFSGAFVMASWVTPKFQRILLWSPSAQSIEMIRGGQFGATAHAMYSITYALCINFLLILAGLSLTLRVRKFVKVQ